MTGGMPGGVRLHFRLGFADKWPPSHDVNRDPLSISTNTAGTKTSESRVEQPRRMRARMLYQLPRN
jgi:hypothetical protein